MGNKEAKRFKKKYKIKELTSEIIISVLEEQGYTTIEFDGINESKDVSDLIDALNLKEYTSTCRGFTYQDDTHRLVFVNKGLNEEEKLIVLTHEEGHIWNKHMTRNNVFGEDVIQEHEANEFAHYLLKDTKKKKAGIIIAACLLVAIVACSGFFIAKANYNKRVYTDHYYITTDGNKYHLKNCMYIKNKTNVKRLTKKDFKLKKYKPCKACLPEE